MLIGTDIGGRVWTNSYNPANVFIAGRDGADRIYWYSVTGNSWFLAGGAGVSSTILSGGK
jgi:hypothetical protein